MGRYAAIDIGTNSVKMIVGEHDSAGRWRTVSDEVEITRLGQNLAVSGTLEESAMERTRSVIARFFQTARDLGATDVVAAGTMALRTAANATAFVSDVKSSCGLKIEIISGEEEARLSFAAVVDDPAFSGDNLVVFDIGGGSTEFIRPAAGGGLNRRSIDVGAVRFTESILVSDPVSVKEFTAARQAIAAEIAEVELPSPARPLVGIGGTPTTLAAVSMGMLAYEPELIHGSRLCRAEIDELVDVLQRSSIAQRRQLPGMPAKRADVILAGALIVTAIMEKTGSDTLSVSNAGLRHSLLRDRFAGANNQAS